MENNMTAISQKMYDQAASGQLTICEAVVFLEKEMKMRTLREKFEKFFHGLNLKETLVQGMLRNHPDRDRDFAEQRVNDWLNNPANQTLEKGEAIEQCFVLGLSVEEADAFVTAVCEEGLHWRNPDEVVYIFALQHGMGYGEAEELNEEMKGILSRAKQRQVLTEDSFTSVIRQEVSALSTKEELADYLTGAVSRLGEFHNRAYNLFVDMLEALEHPTLYETEERAELFEPEKLTIRDIIKEYFYESNVLYARERSYSEKRRGRELSEENAFILTEVKKKISDHWPNEKTLERMKARETDVTRKALILLFLATDAGPAAEDEEDMESAWSAEEVFEDLYQRLNDMLLQCNFMQLDPRSPFDWLILYCICVEDMFDVDVRMKAVFKEMFGERP